MLAAVLVVLVISLAAGFQRIDRLEGAIDSEVNFAIWHIGQIEVDLYKFKDQVHGFFLGDPAVSQESVMRSFDVLWSRLDVALESRETEAVRQVEGLEKAIGDVRLTLSDLEPAVQTLSRDDPSTEVTIDQALTPLLGPLHEVVVDVYHETEWNAVYRESRIKELHLQIELAFLGVLLSGGALIFLLFRELRHGTYLLDVALEAKEAHRQSEMRFRAFLENAPAPLYLKDLQGRYTLVNRRFEEWYGLDAGVAIGKATADFFPAGTAEDYLSHDGEAVATGGPVQREHGVALAGGESRYVLTTKFPIRDSLGDTVGIGAFNTDISDRKMAEEALVAAKEGAEVADRAKAEFLANMSHELRTPLHAVIGFADFIKDEKLGPLGIPEYLESANYIREAGQHLIDLIGDILDMSKVEAGEAVVYDDEIDIPRVIRACTTLVMERAHAADVRIEEDLPPGLPRLRADQRMVKQILINLLSNAVKFTPGGGRVVVTVVVDPAAGLALKVTDEGIGMRPADIPVALSRFGQIRNDQIGERKGTGLGLPLSCALAELHDGRLEIESELGAGTTVTVHFPADRVLLREPRLPAPRHDSDVA